VSLAGFQDANRWLDGTKIKFETIHDADAEATEADSVVKAALAGLYPDHINLWIETLPDSNPDGLEETPDLVRTVASLLMASYRYAKKYSEEILSPSSYALALEAKAMSFLNRLRDGSMSLADESYISELQFQSSNFWPNDTTVASGDLIGLSEGDPLRFFTTDRVF
jgi:hypothetical protein